MAIEEYLQIVAAFDTLLVRQVELDVETLQHAIQRKLSDQEIIEIKSSQIQANRWAYLGAGMNDYLSKPISPDALEAALSGQTGSVAGLTELIPASSAQTPSATPQAGLDAELDTLFDHLDFDDA